ncbi:MAG: hypothetical protein ACLFR2_00505 [Candidatus Kapaibacterium sp.]
MIRIILYIIFLAILNSCELIVIGTKYSKQEIFNIDQTSAIGTVYLFKTELDSNNISAATQLLADSAGYKYLAIEKYEMRYEIARVKRLIGDMPITLVRTDTLTNHSQKINVEFDYLKRMSFRTEMIDSAWYIVSYDEADFN